MQKPKLFIGSSTENLDAAYAVQEELEFSCEPTVWTQGVFKISKSGMEALNEALDSFDFGVFLFSPDDVTSMRGENFRTARDNIVFELGMFIGRLGRERNFIIKPRGVPDFHMPTDLLGVTVADYDQSREDRNMRAALGPACHKVKKGMATLGKLRKVDELIEAIEKEERLAGSSLVEDPDDCISILESWMGSRPDNMNLRVMVFSDVDRELNLAPGSTRKYLAQAASRWKYVPARMGATTALLRRRSDSF